MEKADLVRSFFKEHKDAAILLSGGVDSSVLALLAAEGSESSVTAVTFKTPLVSEEEIRSAMALARQLGLPHTLIEIDLSEYPEVKGNGKERCYWCRKILHRHAFSWALDEGITLIADGVQADEVSTSRPGLRAAEEDGILHPLAEAGLTKEEIRDLARKAGLPNAEKPAAPCLATRFPPGIPLDGPWIERLKIAEATLAGMGFTNFRIRFFPPGLAMLEIDHLQMEEAWSKRDEISTVVKAAGFPVVSLDLEGLERGKMDRFLEVQNR